MPEQTLTIASERRHSRLIARAWTDPAFLERLQSEPAAVLRESGYSVPAGAEVRVVDRRPAADSPTLQYVVLPPRPAGRLQDLWLANEQPTPLPPVDFKAPGTPPPPQPPPDSKPAPNR